MVAILRLIWLQTLSTASFLKHTVTRLRTLPKSVAGWVSADHGMFEITSADAYLEVNANDYALGLGILTHE